MMDSATNNSRAASAPRSGAGGSARQGGASSPTYHRHTYYRRDHLRRPSKDYTHILILGPSGVGKSSLINMVSDEEVPVASQDMGLCTTRFRSSWATIADRTFRLIDSPGFNTNARSNLKIFRDLINYLANTGAKLSGVLYLHPRGSDLDSDQLKQILGGMQCLSGDLWMPYITVVVVGNGILSDPEAVQLLQAPTSPFHPFHAGAAKIRCLELELVNIQEVLLDFDPMPQVDASIYSTVIQYHKVDHDRLDQLISEVFGPQQARRPPRITLEESEKSRQQLELALAAAENEMKSLRSQLEQTRLEYGALRSELQLHDNTEQNRILQSLKDLNRSIEDFGRSVAEHLVVDRIDTDDDVTTLQASNLQDLKKQFEHREGTSSLVTSSTGQGMPLEDFVDLALRSILCQRLYETVFLPFHPLLAATPQLPFMTSLYEGVRCNEPPTVAAKWRASAFIALSKGKGSQPSNSVIDDQAEQITKNDISKLFHNFFGQKTTPLLTEQQKSHLKQIISSAWDWNSMMKGDVVTLGDCQPTFHHQGSAFDPRSMLEFELDKNEKSSPTTAICTIGLGLSLYHSKINRGSAEPFVMHKATVITERVYNQE